MTASCRIWTGTLPVMRHQYQAGEKPRVVPLTSRTALMAPRYHPPDQVQISAICRICELSAPSGSASHGNTARSTTTFATSNADHCSAIGLKTAQALRKQSSLRQNHFISNEHLQKLAAQPSSSDLASSSDADMYFMNTRTDRITEQHSVRLVM